MGGLCALIRSLLALLEKEDISLGTQEVWFIYTNAQWLDKGLSVSLWAEVCGSFPWMNFTKDWAVQTKCQVGMKLHGISSLFTKTDGWGIVVSTPKLSLKLMRARVAPQHKISLLQLWKISRVQGRQTWLRDMKLEVPSYGCLSQRGITFNCDRNCLSPQKLYFAPFSEKSVEFFTLQNVLWKAFKMHVRSRLIFLCFQNALEKNKTKTPSWT